jgi:hypothetical protein
MRFLLFSSDIIHHSTGRSRPISPGTWVSKFIKYCSFEESHDKKKKLNRPVTFTGNSESGDEPEFPKNLTQMKPGKVRDR